MLDRIFVTGGSRGIGSAIVRLFSDSGCQVVFTYKNSQEQAQKLAQETGAFALYCDVADEESVVSALSRGKQLIGDIDVLINNAGISKFGLLCDMTASDWHHVQTTNVDGMFHTIKHAQSMLRSGGAGRIINISSVWGVYGAACEAAYSASKAAVIGLTRAMAKELSMCNITVNAVAPGVINTDMNRCYSPEDMELILQDIPMGRIAEPEEVAHLVKFLASSEAGYITGQVIGIDGGFC